jgi:four helix bundle suffix protein
MELKLTNVARASLEELRLDYQDFLRQRDLPEWTKTDPRRADLIARRPATSDDVAAWCREQKNGRDGQNGQPDSSTSSTTSTMFSYPEITANAALILITVACSLLDRQVAAQAAAFEKDGGFTERLYKTRQAARKV